MNGEIVKNVVEGICWSWCRWEENLIEFKECKGKKKPLNGFSFIKWFLIATYNYQSTYKTQIKSVLQLQWSDCLLWTKNCKHVPDSECGDPLFCCVSGQDCGAEECTCKGTYLHRTYSLFYIILYSSIFWLGLELLYLWVVHLTKELKTLTPWFDTLNVI